MSFVESIILGLVQGLTEFLPISSSGHLVIVQHFLPGFQEPGLLFDLLLHAGTLGAACIYFRRDLRHIFLSLTDKGAEGSAEGCKLAWLVLAGSIPTALIGLACKDIVSEFFNAPTLAALMLLVTAGLLLAADRVRGADRSLERVTWLQAILIGTMQGLAITPGISRSGSTIAVGIFCKLERDLAARYSFLLMIPAVGGATLLEGRKILGLWQRPDSFGIMLAGTLTALLAGYLTIDVLMRVVRNKRLSYFAYYCLAVGLSTMAVLALS